MTAPDTRIPDATDWLIRFAQRQHAEIEELRGRLEAALHACERSDDRARELVQENTYLRAKNAEDFALWDRATQQSLQQMERLRGMVDTMVKANDTLDAQLEECVTNRIEDQRTAAQEIDRALKRGAAQAETIESLTSQRDYLQSELERLRALIAKLEKIAED